MTLTVTKLERHEDGYWQARVSCDGVTVAVDRKHGSWQSEVRSNPRSRTFVRREVLPAVAEALQAKVRAAERREQVPA